MIALREGWWWPEADRYAHGVVMRDALTDIPALLAHVPGRALIVQAGANVGVYPAALAPHFDTVMTVEPDEMNFHCLTRNLLARDVPNVVYTRAAFGEEKSTAAIDVVSADNVGAHRIKPGQGDIEVIRIDDLPLDACDAIWLDIEGYELSALKGAQDTIRRFGPVISIEDKGLGEHFGVAAGAVQAWLAELQYHEVARIGRDKVFKRTPQ